MTGKRLKVMTIVGTRPEIIRLSRVMVTLMRSSDHVLVHTGQNYDYELNQVFFEDLGLPKPDYFLDSTEDSNSASQTIGNVIAKVDAVLAEVSPEAVLILGDTNSCLAALPAKRRKIPVFHMEAGNRCFDDRVPEEINRRIVDHTADINLPYSDIARQYLLREGLPPDRVITTGSPMREVLTHYRDAVDSSSILDRLELSEGGYFLVSAHREENIDPEGAFGRLVDVLNALASEHSIPVVVSTHPRTRARIDSASVTLDERVRLLKPLGFHDYVRLQVGARTVLSDSGTISEESSILSFPALNIREAHERPEAMEEAAVMMTGLSVVRVRQCLGVLAAEQEANDGITPVSDYAAGNVSTKVVRIIHSYTDYVNRVVWKRY
ncbi:MAG: UDP-N-acetylglucosamine 2-epimerase (non-hydrolyzing) [Pseudomonadota bacterium]